MPKKDRKPPEAPMAFLVMANDEMEAEIITSLLDSYNIPSVKQYAGMSGLMTLYMGPSTGLGGINIHVPEAMLDRALEVLANDTNGVEADEGGGEIGAEAEQEEESDE